MRTLSPAVQFFCCMLCMGLSAAISSPARCHAADGKPGISDLMLIGLDQGHEITTGIAPPSGGNGQKQSLQSPEISHRTIKPGEIRILADSAYYDALISLISAAEHRIDMSMYLFKTTQARNNRSSLILQELIKSARRGVAVKVILEKSAYNSSLNVENEKVAGLLRSKGIEVTFDSPTTTTHTKLVVIDRRYSLVGSHNLTHSALAYNNEISLLIDDRDIAEQLFSYMEGIE
ncbi:phospholipase D-like domain-containing protein [Thermodesulfobacteriota bacterium]